jgi:hypothetical protein
MLLVDRVGNERLGSEMQRFWNRSVFRYISVSDERSRHIEHFVRDICSQPLGADYLLILFWDVRMHLTNKHGMLLTLERSILDRHPFTAPCRRTMPPGRAFDEPQLISLSPPTLLIFCPLVKAVFYYLIHR